MNTVLVVEDDPAISQLIKSALSDAGYVCDIADDGACGIRLFDRKRYDLVLLDIMLPIISGYEVLEYIRTSRVPVIMVSARGTSVDKIKGLRLGADDYIAKPFQIGELLARVEAVLRRTDGAVGKFAYRDIILDANARTVTKAGREVELTVKEFDLLAELIRNKGIALHRRQLYEAVWEEEYTGETRTLDSHIQKLRSKLNLNDEIKTVFRIGYRLEA